MVVPALAGATPSSPASRCRSSCRSRTRGVSRVLRAIAEVRAGRSRTRGVAPNPPSSAARTRRRSRPRGGSSHGRDGVTASERSFPHSPGVVPSVRLSSAPSSSRPALAGVARNPRRPTTVTPPARAREGSSDAHLEKVDNAGLAGDVGRAAERALHHAVDAANHRSAISLSHSSAFHADRACLFFTSHACLVRLNRAVACRDRGRTELEV